MENNQTMTSLTEAQRLLRALPTTIQTYSQREVSKSAGREGFDRLVLLDDVKQALAVVLPLLDPQETKHEAPRVEGKCDVPSAGSTAESATSDDYAAIRLRRIAHDVYHHRHEGREESDLDFLYGKFERLDPSPQTWQEISTAPKDGTYVVLVGNLASEQHSTYRALRSCVSKWCERSEDSPFYVAQGWPFAAPGYSDRFIPIAWMPLPSAHPLSPSDADLPTPTEGTLDT